MSRKYDPDRTTRPRIAYTPGKFTTKKGIARIVSEELGVDPDDCELVISAFLNKVTEKVAQGERLEFRGFGVFGVKDRKGKVWENPFTQEANIVSIPDRKVAYFKPSKTMNKQIAQEKAKEMQ